MDEVSLDRVQGHVDELRDSLVAMNSLWGEWVGANQARLAAMDEADAETDLAIAESSKLGEDAIPTAAPPETKARAQAALAEIKAWHIAHVRFVAGNLRTIRETRAVEAGLRYLYLRRAETAHTADPDGTAWIAYLVVGLHLLDAFPEWTPVPEEDQLLLIGARDLRVRRGAQMHDLLTTWKPTGVLAPGTEAPVEDRLIHRAANVARRKALEAETAIEEAVKDIAP